MPWQNVADADAFADLSATAGFFRRFNELHLVKILLEPLQAVGKAFAAMAEMGRARYGQIKVRYFGSGQQCIPALESLEDRILPSNSSPTSSLALSASPARAAALQTQTPTQPVAPSPQATVAVSTPAAIAQAFSSGAGTAASDLVSPTTTSQQETAAVDMVFSSPLGGGVGTDTHLTPGSPVNGALILGSGDTLNGDGAVLGPVTNGGLVKPGNSPGIIQVNSYEQTASGTLEIQIFGTGGAGAANGWDQLQVIGGAVLNGTLEVQTGGGYSPAVGDTFPFLTYGSESGDFTTFQGLAIGNGLYFRPELDSAHQTYDLVVAAAPGQAQLSGNGTDDYFAFLSGKQNIGNFITVGGSVAISSATVNGQAANEIVGSGITIFMGVGPATLNNGSINPNATGLYITDATLGLIEFGSGTTATYALDATGNVQLLGTSGVQISGSATVQINDTQTIVDQTLIVPGANQSVLVQFSTAADVETFTAANLAVNVLGQSLSGTFSFSTTTDSNGQFLSLLMAASSVTMAFGPVSAPVVQVSQGAGELQLTTTGLAGTLAATVSVSVPGVSVSGTLGIVLNTTANAVSFTPPGGTAVSVAAGPFAQVAGTSVSLSINGQSLTGDFDFEQVTQADGSQIIAVSGTGVALNLAAGGTTLVAFTQGQGNFVADSAGLAGQMSGTVSIPAANFSGTFGVEVNTTSSAVNESFTVDGTAVAIALPAGPYLQVTGTSVQLTIAGQVISGDFTFEQLVDGNAKAIVYVAANNVSFALSDGTTTYLSLSGGQGAMVLTASGIAGQLSGAVSAAIPGVTLGNLLLQVNQTSLAVNESFTVGGSQIALNLPAGPYLEFAETGLSVTVLGQTLTGDFAFEQSTDTVTNQTIVQASAANVSLTLGGGQVTVSNGQAAFVLTSAGLAGQGSGTVVVNAPGIALSANLAFAINTTGNAVAASLDIPGGTSNPVALSLAAGQYVQVSGTSVNLTILGLPISGDLTFAAGTSSTGATVVVVTVNNLHWQLSVGGTPVISITNGTGELIVYSQGVAGFFSFTSVIDVPGLGTIMGGTRSVQVNTTSAPVAETFGGTSTVDLPAGPYFRIDVIGASVAVSVGGSSYTMTGDFSFEEQTDPDGTQIIRIGVDNLQTTVTIGGASASVTGGQGGMIINANGVAGVISGVLTAAAGGVQAGGQVVVRINNTGAAVNETVVVNGQSIAIDFGATEGDIFSASISNLTLNIDNFVTIQGNVTFTSSTVNSQSVQVFAGDNLSVFLGQGPVLLANGDLNPLATGVLLGDAQVGLIQFGSGSTATYALSATGTVQLVGLSDISVAGTATVLVNTTGLAINDTITIPGSTTSIPVVFATTASVTSFEAQSAVLTVLGQTLSGDFAFSQVSTGSANTVMIAGSGLSLSLGNGVVTATQGQGALVISGAGVAGSFAATVSTTIAGVTFGGTYSVTINTTSAAVNETVPFGGNQLNINIRAGPLFEITASNATLTVLNQTLSGNFDIEQTTAPDGTSTTVIGVTSASLTLQIQSTPIVSLTNGTGAFLLTSQGVAGQVAGSVAVSIPGPSAVTFSGTFSLAINNLTTAVDQQIVVDGQTISLDLPRGPYVQIQGTGIQLSLLGQSLTGNFTFQQTLSTDPVPVPIVTVTASDVNLSLGDGTTTLLQVLQGQGVLVITSSGIAAQVSGTVRLVPINLNISGISLDFNTIPTVNLDTNFELGGLAVNLSLPAGPFFSIAEPSVNLSLPGLTLHGDLSFQLVTDTLGVKLIHISIANVSFSLPGLSITGGLGDLYLTNFGLAGLISINVTVNLPNVSFSGSLSFEFNTGLTALVESFAPSLNLQNINLPGGPFFQIQGTGISLNVLGQVLTGNFSMSLGVSLNGTSEVVVTVDSIQTSLAGGLVTAQNGTGVFVISAAGIAGQLSADVAVNVPNVSFSGTFTLQLNTTTAAFAQTFMVGASTYALDLPAGPYLEIDGTGIQLAISGQTLTGNLVIQQFTVAGSQVVNVAISDVSLTLGDGINQLLSVTNGSGDFIVFNPGATTATAGLAGTLTATATLNVPSLTLTGTFTVSINTTTNAVDDTFIAGQSTVTVNLPAGPFLQVQGTNLAMQVTISAFNATLSGNFTFTQEPVDPQNLSMGQLISVSISNGEIGFGDGTNTLVRATNMQGTLVITAAGIFGQLTAAVGVDIPQVSFSGTFTFSINTTLATQTMTTPAATLPPDSFEIDGSTVTLQILGQPLSATSVTINEVTETGGAKVVTVGVTGLSITLASSSTTILSVSGVSGAFVISAAGIAGTLQVTGTSTFNLPGGITLSTTSLDIGVNTGAAAVVIPANTLPSQTADIDVPAGPFVQVEADGATLKMGSSGTGAGVVFSGNFLVEQTTDANSATVVTVAMSDVSLTFGGQSLTNGEGAFVLLPADPSVPNSGGLAGFLTAQGTVGGGGVNASGSIGLTVNESGLAVNETVQLNGQTFTISFANGNDVFQIVGSGNLSIGSPPFVTVDGTVTFSSGFFSGTNLDVFLGQGPGTLSGGAINPSAHGILLSSATVDVQQFATSGDYALYATGTVTVLGAGGATITGTATIEFNNSTSSWTDPNNAAVTIATSTESFEGTSLQLSVLGQTLTGDFAFSTGTDASGAPIVNASVTNGTLTLGGSTNDVSLTGINGAVQIGSAGVAAVVDAAGTVNITGFGTSSLNLMLEFNTTPAAVTLTDAVSSNAVTVQPGVLLIQATGIDLTILGQTLTGDFAFEQIATPSSQPSSPPTETMFIAADNVSLTLSVGSPSTTAASLTGGQGGLVITSTGLAGQLTGTIALPGLNFSGTFSVGINNTTAAVNQQLQVGAQTVQIAEPAGPYLQFAGTAVTFTLLGQSIQGNFDFEHGTDASNHSIVNVTASDVSIELGDGTNNIVSLTGGQGSLVINAQGFAGSLSGFLSIQASGFSFAGSFSLALDQNSVASSSYLEITGTGVTLSAAGQTLQGDVTFEQTISGNGQRLVSVAIANASLTLGGTTPEVTIANGQGDLLLTSTGLFGTISGTVTTNIPGVALSGTLQVEINTTTSAVQQSFTVGGQTQTVTLPAGPFLEVAGTGVTLTILSQTLTGDIALEQETNSAGQQVTVVVVNGLAFSLGSGSPPVVQLSNGQGILVATASGLAGSLSATVALNLPGNASFAGSFGLEVNSTNQAINESITLGTQTIALTLPQGPFVEVSGTSVVLNIAGQTLTGNFAFQQATDATNATVVMVAASNVTLSLGDGATTYVKATQGQGTFLVTSSGLAGQLSAAVALNVPGVSLTGTFGVAFNNTTSAVNSVLTLGNGSQATLVLPAGPYLNITASNASLQILGQTLSGSFNIEQTTDNNGQPVVAVAGTGIGLSLTVNASNSLQVTQGTLELLLNNAGVAGQITGNVSLAIGGLGTIGPSAVTVSINTESIAVTSQFSVDGVQLPALDLPAGPYLQVEIDNLSLQIQGVTLTGDFTFESETLADGTTALSVAGTSLSLQLGTATTYITFAGQGALLITADGLAGEVSGTINTSNLPVAFSGDFSLLVNTSTSAVDESFTVDGQTIALSVPAGPYLRVAGTDVELTVAGKTISGDFTFEQTTDSMGNKFIRITAANVALALGNGSANFVHVSDASGTLVIDNDGFAGSLTASITLTIPGVQFSGTFTLSIAETGAIALDEQFQDVNNQTVTISVPANTTSVSVSGQGISLSLLGQTLQGNFSFSENTTNGVQRLLLTASNVTLGLGDGTTTYVLVTGGSGVMEILSDGVAGELQATVTLQNIPDITFTGTFNLDINTTSQAINDSFSTDGGVTTTTLVVAAGPMVQVQATGAELAVTVAGQVQTLTGDFGFLETQAGGQNVVQVSIANADLKLEAGGSTIFDFGISQGNVLITPSGIAGSMTATLNSDLFSFFNSGAVFTLEMNTMPIAANGLPAGPFFEVAATGVGITVGGEILSGDITVEQFDDPTAGELTAIGVANISFSGSEFDSSNTSTFSNGTGGLVIFSDGIAGVISAQVSGGTGGVSGSGNVILRMNTSPHAVDETIDVGGQQVVVRFNSSEIEPSGGSPFFALGVASLDITIGNYLTIEGSISFSNITVPVNGVQTQVQAFAGDGITLFLGRGPPTLADGSANPNAIGVLLSNAQIGLLDFGSGEYALYATGTIAFLGLDGLTVTGQGTIEVNTTGQVIDNVMLSVPNTTTPESVTVNFPTPDPVETFTGTIDVSVAGVLDVSGSVAFTEKPNGDMEVSITNATVAITIGGQQAFTVTGSVSFTISATDGFEMDSIDVNGFSIFGVGAALPAPVPPPLLPEVDLANPVEGQVLDRAGLNTQGYIDIAVTDPNNVGLDNSSILTSTPKFTLMENGAAVTGVTIDNTPTVVAGEVDTYQFTFTGSFTDTGDVEIDFPAGAFQDLDGNGNAATTEIFTLVNAVTSGGQTTLPAAGPTASLTSPKDGATLDPATLNATRFIDVTFTSRGSSPINPSTITGNAFTLSGPGVVNVKMLPNGLPDFDGPPTLITGTTYRFFLQPADTTNANLFGPGEVDVNFQANAWATMDGTYNDAHVEEFTLTTGAGDNATAAGPATAGKSFNIGPLNLQGPSLGIAAIGFENGYLMLTISIGVNVATLDFGSSQGSSGVTAQLTSVLGLFDIGVNPLDLIGGKVEITGGKFSFRVGSLDVNVPGVVEATASGLLVTYDPNGPSNQQLVSIQSASLTFPSFGLTGLISPYNPNPSDPTSVPIPGLVVYENGFQFGTAELIYTPTSGQPITFGSLLQFNDLRIGVSDFGVTFANGGAQTTAFSGQVFFASGGAEFLPGEPISASITYDPSVGMLNPDGTPDTDALRATLSFSNGKVNAFLFYANTVSITLSSYVTLTAQNIQINTGAAPNQELVSFTSIGAEVKIGSLELGGEARNFAFLGNGSFETLPGFGVFLTVGSATGGSFMWPSWLPVHINQIGIEWPNIESDPSNFTLILSVSVTSLQGVPGLQFSGSIQGIQIDPSLLAQGEFPIIGIGALGVSVTGNVFGGQLNAELVGGMVELDAQGNQISDLDTTTPVAQRILYFGVEGGFNMVGMAGFTIRFGLSALGPLDVFIDIEVPGGVVLDPVSGLAINDFSAGVEFFKTLPSITDPLLLRDNDFQLPTAQTADQWLDSLQAQVVAQYQAIQANPDEGGFGAAFTSPMTIIGSATLYSIYTSQQTFNAQVVIEISTDGKFFIDGILNFADNTLSISAKIYADLSNISSGSATILFLADIPDQIQLLTIDGKFRMGFENASGQPVQFQVLNPPAPPNSVAPTASLADPSGDSVDVNVINASSNLYNGQQYIDVLYTPSSGAVLDYNSILNPSSSTVQLTVNGSAVTLESTPIPMVNQVNADGTTSIVPLVAATGDTLLQTCENTGVTEFRYLITQTPYTFPLGQVSVTIPAGSFKNADTTVNGNTVTGASNAAETSTSA